MFFSDFPESQHRRFGIAAIDRKSPDQNSWTQTGAGHQAEDFHPGIDPEVAVGVDGFNVDDDELMKIRSTLLHPFLFVKYCSCLVNSLFSNLHFFTLHQLTRNLLGYFSQLSSVNNDP